MTPQPMSPETVLPEVLRAGMAALVEERMRGVLHAEQARCQATDPGAVGMMEGLADLVTAGGERIRPTVLLTGYLAAGGDPAAEPVLDAAVALELLDTCYLIRRDARENSLLRHGAPTLHVRHSAEHERNGWGGDARCFGVGMASLSGDLATALADRLAANLPDAARQVWYDLRIGRLGGSYVDSTLSSSYLEDPWPADCLTGCARGCGSGWYALLHPLLMGAALAGRGDLAVVYQDYARPVHAAWRVRGFLSGGGDHDWYGDLLRGALFDAEDRDRAERTIVHLLDRSRRALAAAPFSTVWNAELIGLAARLTSPP
ncbi:polyprenyl synthetase family protein [Streptomyces sp. FH025]|uniref:polyprenyl synthetase family protein n=1 Tax=Streptomyces sp. FH025 TaxID=2815937 RepID=UPI001A9D0800|nr:polyprenyl synthetase family protein [Streptomyces sp. FH025]MBO1418464.1 polyprenyl synthetase family protein [Streptomyces sp. FH025]